MNKLWRSGIIFTAANFVTLIGQLAFQVLIARRFSEAKGEFGLANGALGF